MKLLGAVGSPGLLNELFAAKLAGHFGLTLPESAIVFIEPVLASLIAATVPAQADLIRTSIGLNFGSRYVRGASPWPVDKPIPAAMWQSATDIFAFDALVQNPDRRYGNQNLLTVGDNLLVFDHESAFSFLYTISASSEPWKLAQQAYLRDHVFFRRLKGKEVNLETFTNGLTALTDAVLAGMVADVPEQWKNDNVAGIERHLNMVRGRAGEFADEIRRFLA